jgi:hypothetical protein
MCCYNRCHGNDVKGHYGIFMTMCVYYFKIFPSSFKGNLLMLNETLCYKVGHTDRQTDRQTRRVYPFFDAPRLVFPQISAHEYRQWNTLRNSRRSRLSSSSRTTQPIRARLGNSFNGPLKQCSN